MTKIPVIEIHRIAKQRAFEVDHPDDLNFNKKGRRINEYEKLKSIKVVDSAFPVQWAKLVREHFSIRDIGQWAWAYGTDNFTSGTPVPCCPRSLAYFDSMYNNPECHLIYTGNYENDL